MEAKKILWLKKSKLLKLLKFYKKIEESKSFENVMKIIENAVKIH